MSPKNILVIALAIAAPSLQSLDYPSSISLPVAMTLQKNNLHKMSTSLGAGLAFDWHGFRAGPIRHGPGVGLSISWPLASDNQALSVIPYNGQMRARWMIGYLWAGPNLGLMPYVNANADLYGLYIVRRANLSKSTNFTGSFGLGPSLGLAFSARNLGLNLEYGLTFGPGAMRQEIGFAFCFRFLRDT